MKQFARFLSDESGATAIEYALIVALIGGVLVTVLQDVGQALSNMYFDIANALDRVSAKLR